MPIGPLKFRPIFKERLWGSQRLKDLYGKKIPADVAIGESWELSDLPGECSQIAEGRLAGVSLRAILSDHYEELGFTASQANEPFGLLIKFLDAQQSPSVQVHPDAAACREIPGAQLKTECWYVVHAEPGASIYRGLKPGVDLAALKTALEGGTVDTLMQAYPGQPGQFHMLPAGTVHALGAGVVVAEIQTPSDTTYRLYDWNRTDANGQSRQLHIEEALRSTRYPEGSPPTGASGTTAGKLLLTMADDLGRAERLLDCDFFSIVHLTVGSASAINFPVGSPFVMICLAGCGHVVANDAPCRYDPGDTILVPKTSEAVLKPERDGEFLLTCLGSGGAQ